MPDSTVVVMDTALPCLSTMVKCVVPLSGVLSTPIGTGPRLPACAVPARAAGVCSRQISEHLSGRVHPRAAVGVGQRGGDLRR